MTWRAGLEAWAHRQWASRGPVAWLLSPLSLVFLAVSRSRRERTVPNRLPVPVVVVGNIYVGGTGKTPVTIALVRELQARGWRPGVISRGFGRREDGIRLINEETPAAEAGDEPLLIARETGVPVAVGRARFEAGRALLEAHPEVDLIVSDDGLQHAALARDVEIAVVGARGLGNGWVLPAGPLREPPSRLDTVDAIVLNTSNEAVVDRIHAEKLKPLSAAGIAAPGRFFAMIRAHDIEGAELELGDHFDFAENPFANRTEDIIFITGKDAVKCRHDPALAGDKRIWVVGLEVKLDSYLIDLIDKRARDAAGRH